MEPDEPLIAKRYRELVLPRIAREPDPIAAPAASHKNLKLALGLTFLILPALASNLDYAQTPKRAAAVRRPVRVSQADLPSPISFADDGSRDALKMAYAHRLPGRQETLLEILEPPGSFLQPSAWLVERLDKDVYRVRCGSYEFDVNLAAQTVGIVPGAAALFAARR